jgi:hypothetical protein
MKTLIMCLKPVNNQRFWIMFMIFSLGMYFFAFLLDLTFFGIPWCFFDCYFFDTLYNYGREIADHGRIIKWY